MNLQKGYYCRYPSWTIRVLILQGGGSLGAYKAGGFRALFKHISEKLIKMKMYLISLQTHQ